MCLHVSHARQPATCMVTCWTHTSRIRLLDTLVKFWFTDCTAACKDSYSISCFRVAEPTIRNSLPDFVKVADSFNFQPLSLPCGLARSERWRIKSIKLYCIALYCIRTVDRFTNIVRMKHTDTRTHGHWYRAVGSSHFVCVRINTSPHWNAKQASSADTHRRRCQGVAKSDVNVVYIRPGPSFTELVTV